MKNTQIHVVTSLAYTIVVAILVAIIVSWGNQRFTTHASYTSELAHATINLAALNHLQLGEVSKAVAVLEQGLAANAEVLDVGSSGISSKLYQSMQAKLREIKQYQASKKK